MKRNTNVIPIHDVEDWEVLRLFELPEHEDRQAERRLEHRREKRNRRLCRLLDVVIVIEAIALVMVIMWNL